MTRMDKKNCGVLTQQNSIRQCKETTHHFMQHHGFSIACCMKARLKLHIVGVHLYTGQHQTQLTCALQRQRLSPRGQWLEGSKSCWWYSVSCSGCWFYRCDQSENSLQIPNIHTFLGVYQCQSSSFLKISLTAVWNMGPKEAGTAGDQVGS